MNDVTPDPRQPSSVGDDVLCLGCGYMLRGLDPAGACPECGQAIARSLGPAHLCDLDSQWLRRVRRGLRLVAGGLLLLIVLPLAVLSAMINYGLAHDLLLATVLAPTALLFVGLLLCCQRAVTPDQVGVIRRARQKLRFRIILLGTTIGVVAGLFITRLARSDVWLVTVSVVLLLELAFTCHAYAKWLRVLLDRRGRNDPREPWIAPEVATFAIFTVFTIFLKPPIFILSFLALLVGHALLLYATRRVISLLNRAIAHREAR